MICNYTLAKKYFWKFKIFLKSLFVLKNWYVLPIVYFGLIQKPVIYFKTRDGSNLKIRTGKDSSDIHIFVEIWLDNVYFKEFSVKKNSVIIDIGSHIGLFSILAARKSYEGKVYSFEPNEYNYKILSENIQTNKIKNISHFNLAVSNTNGHVKLYCDENDFAAHSIHKKTPHSINVKSTTINDIFYENKIKNCDLLKLDCEGAEYDILMNTSPKIFEKINKICIEYEYFNNEKKLGELVDILNNYKFKIKKNQVSMNMGYLYAWK
jgi:FkbM family methyltransferase